jgi:hypothetical protein
MSIRSETLSYKGCRHAVGVSNLNEDNPEQAVVETTAIVAELSPAATIDAAPASTIPAITKWIGKLQLTANRQTQED